ncbi:HAMP domain-containing histidine kinase [Psychroflexus sp. YR1-1]|uniref:histidine kinase n=1 Tax=Psychroflexus aurantiacus TaxID=2709310 RepID=A0A6B3R5X7_9FLAO|nr:HAMP domain-containing sensor histidine kinase [Psychroflexus aurantiacus]NEV94527.1 HAMP domain-containing histidine kinase [Psychroflexus aurantiacus]
MLAISYVSFNTIAIWKPSDAMLQFGVLSILIFSLDYLNLFDVEELLLIGGYTTFSICMVSLAFPSIKSLSLKDQIEEEYSKSQKISDFKSANQNLKKENDTVKTKLSFLENKAKIYQHDLNNQLSSIESLVDLIELEDRYVNDGDADNDYLDLIKNTLKDSKEENENFFKNFSKEEIGKESYNKTNLNLNQLIKENIRKFSEKISSRNIQIDLELNAKECCILADKTILNTSFYNIFKYAIDFSNNNDSVKIITRNEDKLMIFELVNRSSGMSMIELESYFKNIKVYDFEDIQGNKGLGLAIARKNIELMDGNLRYSASKSLGFEFIVEFQLND